MSGLRQDLRYALRSLLRSPRSSALVALSLALAVAANGVLFGVLKGVLLHPLPFPEPRSLFLFMESGADPGQEELMLSVPAHRSWSERADHLVTVAGAAPALLTLRDGGDAEALKAALVTDHFFATLGVRPVAGRDLRRVGPSGEPVAEVVLSHRLWTARFGGEEAVLGRTLSLGDVPVSVVGVAPAGIETPGGTQLWGSLSLLPALYPGFAGALTDPSVRLLHAFARLRPGVDAARARRELAAMAPQVAAGVGAVAEQAGADLVPLRERAVRRVKPSLLLLQLAAGLVLVLAAFDAGGVALARALDRRRELAVRAALGAGRSRILRLVVMENLLLALAGGVAGVALAVWGLPLAVELAPLRLPYADAIRLDAGVMGATLLAAVAAGVVASLLPAWRASVLADSSVLAESSGPDRAVRRAQGALVVVETALAVLLLIGGGLLVRSFQELQAVEPGFEPGGVLALSLSLPADRYEDPTATAAFFAVAGERLRGIPGVVAVGVASDLPMEGVSGSSELGIPGGEPLETPTLAVDPGYFRALGIPLVRGRLPRRDEIGASPRVLLVNRSLASRLWPGDDPVGRTLVRDGREVEVVGVVGDVHHHGLAEPPGAVAYEPAYWNNSTVLLKTASPPADLGDRARRVLAGIAGHPPYRILELDEVVGAQAAPVRFLMSLFVIFGGVAMLLSAIGLFATLLATATSGRRQIAVRLALGAGPGRIVLGVLGRGLGLAGIGIATAVAVAAVLSPRLEGLLFTVSALDPLSYLAAGSLMALVALAACALPAARAARVDPAATLREE